MDDIQDIGVDGSEPAKTRQSFRVPVGPEENVSVMIKQKTYKVIDISTEGVRILHDAKIDFEAAQLIDGCDFEIDGCALIFPGVVIKNLTAQIKHFSPFQGEGCENGIQWVNLTDGVQEEIAAQVKKIKMKFLASKP